MVRRFRAERLPLYPVKGMASEKVARHYHIIGLVQGVGYRYFTRKTAEMLGLAGWVRNLPDGAGEAYAIGSEGRLAQFESALRHGPRHAEVQEVVVEDAPVDPVVTLFSVRF